MPQVQIADVVVPAEFTAYQVENSMVNTALFQSGVISRNGAIEAQLQAGAESFTVPLWADLADTEADITNDDPTILSTPQKVTANKQNVRKSFLHQSWSEMSLASELSGSDALARIQDRVSAYWDRQFSKRLIASLQGVLANNVANNSGDMVVDISGNAGTAAQFNGDAVIDTAITMGDRLSDFKAIAMHSYVYSQALKNNDIEFFKPSENGLEMLLTREWASSWTMSLPPPMASTQRSCLAMVRLALLPANRERASALSFGALPQQVTAVPVRTA